MNPVDDLKKKAQLAAANAARAQAAAATAQAKQASDRAKALQSGEEVEEEAGEESGHGISVIKIGRAHV